VRKLIFPLSIELDVPLGNLSNRHTFQPHKNTIRPETLFFIIPNKWLLYQKILYLSANRKSKGSISDWLLIPMLCVGRKMKRKRGKM